MKRIGILIWALALLLSSCAAPAVAPELTETEGRPLLAENGTALLVTEDGPPIVLSIQTDGDGPWWGYHSGDRIRVTHDGINETYPAQTGAYAWERLEEGTPEDIPEETLAALEDLGWNFGREIHEPAAEPQTVKDPVTGYCGNTVTEVTLDGETYSFGGGDSVTLTDIVINLAYDPEAVCSCLPEFLVDTEFGDGYSVNLTEYYVRCQEGQAPLTAEQAEKIRGIVERNCK